MEWRGNRGFLQKITKVTKGDMGKMTNPIAFASRLDETFGELKSSLLGAQSLSMGGMTSGNEACLDRPRSSPSQGRGGLGDLGFSIVLLIVYAHFLFRHSIIPLANAFGVACHAGLSRRCFAKMEALGEGGSFSLVFPTAVSVDRALWLSDM